MGGKAVTPARMGLPICRQDFAADFDALTVGLRRGYDGPPYAFVRFGDGEAAIMRGDPHAAKSDGWEFRGGVNLLAPVLLAAARCSLPGFYIGISAEEHHQDAHRYLRQTVVTTAERITFAELFIFANYDRWRSLDLRHCLTVGSGGVFYVPPDAVVTDWDYRPTVDALIGEAGGPILVAAGPVANALIYDYWLRCPPDRRQVVLDVGSAIDERMKKRRTRRYHAPGSDKRRWRPLFSLR